MLLPFTALALALAVGQGFPEPPAPDDDPRILSTDLFDFYSHFELNLHDFLYYQAQEDSSIAFPAACDAKLGDEARAGWTRAVSHYAADMGGRHHRTDSLMRALRYQLGGTEWDNPGIDLSEIQNLLDGASQAYRDCWWTSHDERNRAWTNELAERLFVYQDTLRHLLESYFMEAWTGKIPVDVVTYASWGGANTVPEPAHIMMSSVNRKYKSYKALEMVFHEAAHLTMHNGKIRPYVAEVPRGAWHAILFYIAGETTRRVLAEDGIDYVPYMHSYSVFRRWHDTLAAHWPLYLDGEASWEESVRATVAAAASE